MPTLSEATITCPKCRTSIPLTEAMAGPLLAQANEQHARDLAASRAAVEEELRAKAKVWANEKAADARKESTELRAQLADMLTKLTAAQEAQAAAVRRETAVADRERELELTIAKRVQAESVAARAELQRQADETAGLKVAEQADVIRNLQEKIADLNQRAAQGSTQNQGEAQEIALETSLRAAFPMDEVVPVGKGVFGGDALQHVRGRGEETLGTILWESKRTKNWTAGWVGKLKGDQRAAKADVAVIATQAMPEGVDGFGMVDGVWVCSFRYALPVAFALRQSIIDLAAVRASRAGMATKAEETYGYLTGPHFKQRVGAVVERLMEMRKDLEQERTAMTRIWSKREGQLLGAATAMSAMFGDLQAVAQGALEGLPVLELGEGV